jgi:hypothetical protein
MSIGEGGREEAFEAYKKMRGENMTNQPETRRGEIPPVLAPEYAGKKGEKTMNTQPKGPEAGEAVYLGDLDKKLADGTMTPQEAETYASQILDASPDLLATLDEIDQLSLPTPEEVNLGLATEVDQEKAAKARQSLIDQATTRVVTFFVKEAGRGAYKDVPPLDFVLAVRDGLHETMERALVPIMADAKKRLGRRMRGEMASTKQAA